MRINHGKIIVVAGVCTFMLMVPGCGKPTTDGKAKETAIQADSIAAEGQEGGRWAELSSQFKSYTATLVAQTPSEQAPAPAHEAEVNIPQGEQSTEQEISEEEIEISPGEAESPEENEETGTPPIEEGPVAHTLGNMNVKIRAGTSTDSAVVGQLSPNTSVVLTGEGVRVDETKVTEGIWYPVQAMLADGSIVNGYVRGDLLVDVEPETGE